LAQKQKEQGNFSARGSHFVPLNAPKEGRREKNLLAPFAYIFGPYPNSTQLREALKIVRKIFPFLDDKSKNYIEFYRQINLVPDLNDTKLYKQNIKNIILFFSGKKQQIFKNLKKEMQEYAKAREFERAGEVKRQLFALQHINDVALLKQENFYRSSLPRVRGGSHTNKNFLVSASRIEAYDIAHMGGKNMVGVMVVVEDGEVNKNEYRKFKIRTQKNSNDTGALTEVLERRLAHPEWTYPALIVVDGGVAQINAVRKILKKTGHDIPIVSVLKNEQHKPKAIMGDEKSGLKDKREILLANSEAHRFAINYHKKMRNNNFLK
jgi:excinuclease UvrABC nuclease subunit